MQKFSTDVPKEFHSLIEEKYLGRTAWTRRTLQDEKKNVKIEQDQEVRVTELGLKRNGSVTIVSKNGRNRVVYPFQLQRPLVLEFYEKSLLDVLWFDSPEVRYEKHKQEFGERVADAIREHKILKDMSQRAAYLAWGQPTQVTGVVKRGLDENWEYETPNLTKASIIFRSGRVSRSTGENVVDTEEAKKRSRFRRSS